MHPVGDRTPWPTGGLGASSVVSTVSAGFGFFVFVDITYVTFTGFLPLGHSFSLFLDIHFS